MSARDDALSIRTSVSRNIKSLYAIKAPHNFGGRPGLKVKRSRVDASAEITVE